jgi:hypothetical protein
MAHQMERDWLGLIRELIAALYDALSLQSEAARADCISLIHRITSTIVFGVMITFLLFSAVLFGSMALATLIAQHYRWPLALASVGSAHLLLAIAVILVRPMILRNHLPIFSRSNHVFAALKKSLLIGASGGEKNGDIP